MIQISFILFFSVAETVVPEELAAMNIECSEDVVLSPDAEKAIEKQIETRASDFEHSQLKKYAGRNWDRFYKRNGARFFKVSSIYMSPYFLFRTAIGQQGNFSS